MGFRLEWKGDALREAVRAAEPKAIATTTAAAAAAARTDHAGWASRTGAAEASITPETVRSHGASVAGAIGFAIRPVFFQERGWRYHPAASRALERAAAREFAKLVARLRDAIGNRGG